MISQADIANRARLFAISTGLPLAPDVIDRLKPQILRQLIDERLRMQESQRRKIVIQDIQIAEAIKEIETRNGMQPGALRAKLSADGVSTRTLIDQIRAQLAWSQMLRQGLADRINVSEADIAEQQKLLSQQIGQTEYRIGEIFIPIDDPANSADAQRFAETVISELHAGAAVPPRRRPVQPDPVRAGGRRARLGADQPARSRRRPDRYRRCRSAPSAIRYGSRAACPSSSCRPSERSATKWPPS